MQSRIGQLPLRDDLIMAAAGARTQDGLSTKFSTDARVIHSASPERRRHARQAAASEARQLHEPDVDDAIDGAKPIEHRRPDGVVDLDAHHRLAARREPGQLE